MFIYGNKYVMENLIMKILVNNKKALFNYNISDKYECGISLLGAEVKSIVNNKFLFR